MWRFITPAYQGTHRIVLFDYVGCGKSDVGSFNASRYTSLDGYARDLLEVCEAADVRDAILVGHSVSGVIGLLAAMKQRERFARLVMIAPSPRYIDDPPYVGGFQRRDLEELLSLMDHNYIGWAAHLAPVVMGNPERPELAPASRRTRRRCSCCSIPTARCASA
jgi:sigma-B regulation protein RsbQ